MFLAVFFSLVWCVLVLFARATDFVFVPRAALRALRASAVMVRLHLFLCMGLLPAAELPLAMVGGPGHSVFLP